VLVDVNMSKLGIELLVHLRQKPNRLAIVTVNNQLMARIEPEVSEETLPPDRLFRCIGKSL
jgi:hypothetical protein